jgi:hypothetical protein
MNALTAVLAQTPVPEEDIVYPDPVTVTPGTIGFLFTFFVAVAVVLLARDAMRRARRVRAADNAQEVYPIPMRRQGQRSATESDGGSAAGAADAADADPGDDAAGAADAGPVDDSAGTEGQGPGGGTGQPSGGR